MKRYHAGDEGSIPDRNAGAFPGDLDGRESPPSNMDCSLSLSIETTIAKRPKSMSKVFRSNSLVEFGEIKTNNQIILELWVRWLASEIKIQDDGRVKCYAEWYIPGWLLLQIGRSLWPQVGDVRADGRRTSISLLGLLRAAPDNGYMVDRLSFYNWLHITCYDCTRCLARFKWVPKTTEIFDDSCYQILSAGQVCKGMHRPDEYCWVEIPDMNIQVPLYMLIEDDD